MMDKFTPGPWSINTWPRLDSHISIGTIGTPLVALIPLRDVSINEQISNAKLVKEAPVMLATLRRIIEIADTLANISNCGIYDDEIRLARLQLDNVT